MTASFALLFLLIFLIKRCIAGLSHSDIVIIIEDICFLFGWSVMDDGICVLMAGPVRGLMLLNEKVLYSPVHRRESSIPWDSGAHPYRRYRLFSLSW